MMLQDLEELEDVLDTLVFEDPEPVITEDHATELIETAMHLMDEYIDHNSYVMSEPNFHEIVLDSIKDLFYTQLEDHIDDIDIGDDIEEDMNDLLDIAFQLYMTTFHSNEPLVGDETLTDTVSEDPYKKRRETIDRLRLIPQPTQRTPEWYTFRWNLLTASNAYKAFESQATINQLIYEKCQPLVTTDPLEEAMDTAPATTEIKMVNVNTAMHWGQKYEPLSVMLYERAYKSTVEDFGCIQHPCYPFLGASPDGIVIASETGRYGRMLEIKNPVSRDITGVPKKEYWVQMQLQMEVCDLDDCDFLETKFSEYENYTAFLADSAEDDNILLSKQGQQKGTIIYFHNTKEGRPHYEYMPLHIQSQEDISKWEETTMEKYEAEPYCYTFLKYIYWKLDHLSCILVLRDKRWFKNSIGQLQNVWNIIEKERVTGFEHRAPKQRPKKEHSYMNTNSNSNSKPSTGFLMFDKIVKMNNNT